MTNEAIADQFSLLSKIMDIHGENSFKTKTYSVAAYTIENLPKEITDMSEDELYQVRGIGQATGEKVRELLNTGKLQLLEDMVAKTPTGVLEMLRIKGLGPKKIASVWKELGIESIGELEYACTENRLSALKGFGEKTQDKIAESIRFYQASQGFHLYASVEEFANTLVSMLQKNHPEARVSLTGDIRRQENVIGSVDIITDISRSDIRAFFDQLEGATISEEEDVLTIKTEGQPQIACHCCTGLGFYTTLFRTTGSSEFIQAFESRFTIPEEATDEEAIFTQVGLNFIPPALREDASILDKAASGPITNLITEKDIKAIIHSHSTYSDGAHTLAMMAKEAMKAGYEYLVISDHSQAAYYANGLTPDRILKQHEEIDELNEKLAPFKIFKSIEADILGDGSLDYNEEILSSFDLVIASVHSNLSMSQEKAMDRILAAVRNPFTRILGHPTGRLLLSRAGYPVDHKKLIDTCAAYDVVVEINAHPRRLDVDWKWVQYALEKGVLLSIDPDAHSVGEFKNVRYGALSAQKGGLTAANNLSSFSLAQFEEWLKSKKVPGK